MEPRRKRILTLFLSLVVAATFAGGLMYWLYNTALPTPPPSPTTFDEALRDQTGNSATGVDAAPDQASSTDEPQPQASPMPTKIPMSTSKPATVVTPVNGKVSINIYRDFVYVPSGWPLGLSVGQSNAVGVDTLSYERLNRQPDYRSDGALYGYLPLGNGNDRQISFVFDDVEQESWVAYVDANNNEDLTDDGPPLPNVGTGKIGIVTDVQVEILLPSGQQTVQPYRVWLWYIEEQGNPRFYTQCHYAGKIVLDEKAYTAIAYEKFNHDGLFRESGLWIDLNHDEKLDEATEHFEDGSFLSVDQHEYRIELLYP